MQELWQKKPTLNYSKDVIDIVQFGSSVKEKTENNPKPNDIDIAVIFSKIPLKEQLLQAQNIKKQLQKYTNLPIHIKAFDLYSLAEKSNFAREDILFYGKSIIFNNYFIKLFNLSPVIQIFYNLKNLKKKDKIRFNYLLNGKRGKYGLIRKYGGKIIAPGLIEIKPEYENIFLNAMKKITSNLEIRKILL